MRNGLELPNKHLIWSLIFATFDTLHVGKEKDHTHPSTLRCFNKEIRSNLTTILAS